MRAIARTGCFRSIHKFRAIYRHYRQRGQNIKQGIHGRPSVRKYRVYKSEGNLNSITGMPLSLLAMEDPECAVFEVGMSEPGEIAGLARLLKPHVRVLLNVNPVHLGQFPSVDAIC